MRITNNFCPSTMEHLQLLEKRITELTERIEDAPEPLVQTEAQRAELQADEEELALIAWLREQHEQVIWNRTLAEVAPMMAAMKAAAEKGDNPKLAKDYEELRPGFEKFMSEWQQKYGPLQ